MLDFEKSRNEKLERGQKGNHKRSNSNLMNSQLMHLDEDEIADPATKDKRSGSGEPGRQRDKEKKRNQSDLVLVRLRHSAPKLRTRSPLAEMLTELRALPLFHSGSSSRE